jgi:hypothetical protein
LIVGVRRSRWTMPGRRGAALEGVEALDQQLADQWRAKQMQRERERDPVLARRQRLAAKPMRVGVEDEEPVHPLWMPGCPVQPDRSAPVPRHDRRALQVERLQQRVEPFGVARDAVELRVGGLVGAAEAEVVGHDRAMPGLDQRWDEVAVQIAPGRVAMHHHHRAPVRRTDAKAAVLSG